MGPGCETVMVTVGKLVVSLLTGKLVGERLDDEKGRDPGDVLGSLETICDSVAWIGEGTLGDGLDGLVSHRSSRKSTCVDIHGSCS